MPLSRFFFALALLTVLAAPQAQAQFRGEGR